MEFVCMKGRVREREGETYCLVDSSNGYNGIKPGARNYIQVFQVESRVPGACVFGCFPKQISRSWIRNAGADDTPSVAHMEYWHCRQWINLKYHNNSHAHSIWCPKNQCQHQLMVKVLGCGLIIMRTHIWESDHMAGKEVWERDRWGGSLLFIFFF